MNKLTWLSLAIAALALAVLVICLIVPNHSVSSGEIDFEVDGTQYGVYRFATIDKQGGVVTSSLVVYPSASRKELHWHEDFCPAIGTTLLVIQRVEGGYPVADTETLYFMRDGKIVFEKSYQELGIDAQKLNAADEIALDYLKPILERLIREHVKTKEPEMEE